MDRLEKGDIAIVYCPTDDMTGDYMTKALQGGKFAKFDDAVMNSKQ